MTRSDIRSRILEALNESTTSPVFWSTAQVDAIIDEASEVLAEEALAIRRSGLVGLEQGKLFYSIHALNDDVMAISRVWHSGEERRLTATTMSELDVKHETWQDVTGDPEFWFPVSWDLFGIYPHPTTGAGTLRVDYFAWPLALQSDADEPEFRESDHDGLVLYGIYDGLLKQWNVQRAQEIFVLFMERWSQAQQRSGMSEQQSRAWQAAARPGVPFRSDVHKGFRA